MTNRILIVVLLAVAFGAGVLLGPRWFASSETTEESSAETAAEPEILYWVAPMDPNYRRDEPGKSPMGMDLVPVYADEAGGGDGISWPAGS